MNENERMMIEYVADILTMNGIKAHLYHAELKVLNDDEFEWMMTEWMTIKNVAT